LKAALCLVLILIFSHATSNAHDTSLDNKKALEFFFNICHETIWAVNNFTSSNRTVAENLFEYQNSVVVYLSSVKNFRKAVEEVLLYDGPRLIHLDRVVRIHNNSLWNDYVQLTIERENMLVLMTQNYPFSEQEKQILKEWKNAKLVMPSIITEIMCIWAHGSSTCRDDRFTALLIIELLQPLPLYSRHPQEMQTEILSWKEEYRNKIELQKEQMISIRREEIRKNREMQQQ
jgi:hypothetical protein